MTSNTSQPPGTKVDRGAIAQAVQAIAASVLEDRPNRRPTKTDRIQMVATASAALDAAKESLDETVRQARRNGASWSDIGTALGISRQGAFQRFGG